VRRLASTRSASETDNEQQTDNEGLTGRIEFPSMTALTETSRSGVFQEGGQSRMIWEAPAFVEIKMDAEINSYQDDFDREQDDRF
jgi:hypothetical protein